MAYSLKYSYDSRSQSYTVTGYSNITVSDKVVIPDKYDNGTNGEHPVTSIKSYAFANCSSLTSITIPDSVISIGDATFANCSGLKIAKIGNGLTSISSGVFLHCHGLTSVAIGNSVTSIGVATFANCSSLTSVAIPNSVTSISDSAFIGCSKLTQLILFPSSPPTLGSSAIPEDVQFIYVQQSSKPDYKKATNWTAFASKIVSDNLYLSFVRFNQKNKEYINEYWNDFNLKNGTADVLLTTTDTNRSFKVMADGRAKVQSAPTENDDVVRKKELNTKTSQEVFVDGSLPTSADAKIWIDAGVSTSALSKIYGVDKVGQENPTLTRTDDAVGLSYTVGTSEIASDFDNCYPWCDMQEVTDVSGNVFIKIPKFYSKVTKNTDGTYKYQISGTQHEGFTTLFVDGKGNELDYVLVGKYEGSGSASRIYSKSGATVLVNITRGNFRIGCKANGKGYQQYDFLIDAIIKELFTIEFATTNSQSIMQGYANTTNVAAIITGRTDAVLTPSGSPESNTDGKHACKYRGIENPFGNVWKLCDGINFDTEKIYVCEDPEYYADDKHDAPYTYMGDRLMSEGYLKEVTPFAKNPLLGYATAIGAGSTTHYSDYYYAKNTSTVLLCGGLWFYGASDGLWYWFVGVTAPGAASTFGGRLCYKPL